MISDQYQNLRPSGPAPKTQPSGSSAAPANQPTPAAPSTNVLPDTIAGFTVPPAAQEFASSAVQGLRDIAQKGMQLSQYDPLAYTPPAAIQQADAAKLGAQTQAYEQSPAAEHFWTGALPRYGTQMLATAPVIGPLAEAVPEVGAGAGLLAKVASGAGRGAIWGGGTNLLTGDPNQNPLTSLATGALGGTVLGAATAPLAGMTPAWRQAVQDTANRLGITLTAGQRLGGLWQHVEDATKLVPGVGAQDAFDRQQTQIANLIRREGGMGGTGHIDAGELAQAQAQAGQNIAGAARNISVPADAQLQTDMQAVQNMAQQGGQTTQQANVFGNLSSELSARINNGGGTLQGPDFQSFIASGGPLDNALNNADPNVRMMADNFRRALYNAANRNGQGAPQAVRDWQLARYRYKVLKTVEPQIQRNIGGTAEMSQLGLAQDIRRNFNMAPPLPGAPPPPSGSTAMEDLGQLLSSIKPLRSSGTAERLAVMGGLTGVGAAGYEALQDPQSAEARVLRAAPGYLGLLALGRSMRFAPGLYSGSTNLLSPISPFLPRAFGPYVGNQLTGQGPTQ